MQTGNIKVHFKKGETSVKLDINSDGKVVETKFQTELDFINDEYFVEIPAFNISLSTKEEKNIKQIVHDSVLSFFSYRLDKQGIDKFIITMFELGFEIKTVSDRIKKHTQIKHQDSRQITEKFVLAS